MRPSRVTVTTIPSLGESGRASARGSSTSTPPCMIGAVIMKMIRSTSMTSTSEVTFTSAISGSSPRWLPRPPPRLADISDESFPGHRPHQLVGETFELAREEAGPIHIQVVGDHRGGGCPPTRGRGPPPPPPPRGGPRGGGPAPRRPSPKKIYLSPPPSPPPPPRG